MSESVVISVENLGKSYRLHHQAERENYVALRDVIARQMRGIFRPAVTSSRPTTEEFWALKNVGFEVKQGEVVGIIGRNGAGKSTLLKILSRITEPSQGRVRIKGRVASLLEVGTGFHPELTGRENIYLNGAILGMSRLEVRTKFDEIVAFAEVDRFLDTPVKRYSSGMYVRLAFAVAAHLEPEIMVVDEVLAVGDAQFQRKCLGKMKDVAKGGRTVLFVSHNVAAMTSLCETAILLRDGQLEMRGPIHDVVASYQQGLAGPAPAMATSRLKFFELDELAVGHPEGKPLTPHGPLEIRIAYHAKDGPVHLPDVYLAISTQDGIRLAGFECSHLTRPEKATPDGRIDLRVLLPSLHLMPGSYQLQIELKDLGANKWEFLPDPVPLNIEEGPVYGTRAAQPWNFQLALEPQVSWNGNNSP